MLKDGKPALAVSVAGGDEQDQATLQILMNIIDFGLNCEDAVTRPRFATRHLVGSFRQTPPALGSVSINSEIGDKTIEELRLRGHQVSIRSGSVAAPCVLRIDPRSGVIEAAGDPRAGRHAAAY
jgi:gamma-glutamyltranspeptidase/glutathione hydrolase